ncbi:DUF433 domain-containing protein [Gloeocapsa sp. PCC 73106]|uniref:DUF433 domain-containing protein n=1 Tax=Gloeocapsa sp. PCC 73106 TaxID=102232 RepID=UPI0002AC5A36|nr:DUF433 domain-containing protein [Gloeocapsa sp. PCC 73106]ELR97064.1 hypothetical protein GLO73106DRAFT_00008670 [Gloeocapsa sp. PCC 73106]
MTLNSVNLPTQLQQEAEKWAASQGIPFDQFILWAVAEKVASLRSQFNDPSFPTISYRQGFSGKYNAVIFGTGIRVQTIAVAANQWKLSPQQIAEEYGLSETQCRDALGFYAAHRNEIDSAITAEDAIEKASV